MKTKKIISYCIPKDLDPGVYACELIITEKKRKLIITINPTKEEIRLERLRLKQQDKLKLPKIKYYACLLFKDGHVKKKAFTYRANAHKYIEKYFDENIHTQCWTE